MTDEEFIRAYKVPLTAEEKEERKNRAKAEILEGKVIDFTDDVIDKLFDKCSCYNKIIDDKENICMSGHDLTEVYIGKDRRRLLYKALKAANKELTYKDVILMGAVYGHSSLVKNDFDSIYYSGYVIWLILHKKYKYLCDRDILKAFYNMQFMNMRIPKGIRRKVKRIIRKCEKEQPWWYKEV